MIKEPLILDCDLPPQYYEVRHDLENVPERLVKDSLESGVRSMLQDQAEYLLRRGLYHVEEEHSVVRVARFR